MKPPSPATDRCYLRGEPHAPLQRLPQERRQDFEEVSHTFDAQTAQDEANRCLATQSCSWCNVCILLCPDLCITRNPQTQEIEIDLNYCKGCGLCAHYCPKGALEMIQEKRSEA